MRNLKKVLSLALAMVMLLGMMVVGAGAATKYEDDDKIVNKEAVTVVSAIGVLQGVGENTFNPTGTLTRAEAAVVIAKLDLGADAAAALTATNAATFNDVGTGYGWAKAYIDYCAGRGYIVGDGNGNFLPAKTVSSVEFSAMVLRMLGYRNANEGLTGDSWIINTSALARKSGLTTNVVLSQEGMSRDDMAQMVFNSLTAPTVEYEGMDITVGDVSFNAKAKVRTHTASSTASGNNYTYDRETIYSNITPIRLCEEKFPTLKLIRDDEQDNFGRRCSVWTYKGLKIAGSEVSIVPDLSYTTKVTKETPAEWAKLEGLVPATDNAGRITMQLWINGQYMDTILDQPQETVNNKVQKIDLLKRTRDWISWYTAPGRSVEVYMNKNDLSVVERVVVVDTVLGEVTKENSDGTLSVKLTKTGTETNVNKVTTGAVTLTAAADTIIGDVKKGDMVLVQGYYNGSTAEWRLNKDTTIASVEVAPSVKGFATFKGYSSKNQADYIKVDGEDYSDAYAVERDFAVQQFSLNTENLDCTLYLDNFGYILKAIPGKDLKAVTDNLVAVKELYDTLNNGRIAHMVRGVISSGETVTWQLASTTGVRENEIYTWTRSSGLYTLTSVKNRDYADYEADQKVDSTKDTKTYVANVNSGAINFKSNDVFGKGGPTQAGTVMYSDTVKFIFVAPGTDGSITVLNGRQNYDLPAGHIVAQAFKNDEITAVFINVDPDVVDVSDLIYVHSRYRENDQIVDVDGKQVQYHGYTAYDAKGDKIEDFLGVNNGMAGKFFIAKKTDDGKAYNDYGSDKKAVVEHTFIKGVVANANGLKGDSLVLVDTGEDGKSNTADDIHYDFLGRSSTKVIDLSGSKLNIESISELNDAVNNDKDNGKPQYYVEVAVIYNATDARATQPSVGTVRTPTIIYVTTVREAKADEVPPHNATGIPSVDGDETGSGKYDIKSLTTGNSAIEFLNLKDADVPAASAIPTTGWVSNNTLTANEGDKILVRSAVNGVKLSGVTYFSPDDGATSGLTIAQIGATGVFHFTMPAKSITVMTASTDAISVGTATVGGVEKDLAFVGNTVINIVTDKATSFSGAGLEEFVVDYLNDNGYTASVTYTALDHSTASGIVVNGVTFASGSLHAGNNLVWATVNGKIVVSTNDTDVKVNNFCTLAGLANSVTVSAKDKDGNMIYSGTVSSGSSATVSNGSVIVTLDTAKLAAAVAQKAPNLPTTVPDAGATITSAPEVNNATNLDGALGQLPNGWATVFPDTGNPGDSFADYTALNGRKLTVMEVDLPVTSGKYVRIKQTNEALALYPNDDDITETNGVWVKDSGKTRAAATVEYGIMVVEGSGPITIEVFISSDTSDTNLPATASYTVTIDPSGIKFAD